MMSLDGFRVCFCAGTLGNGGAERQLFYMSNALVSNGCHVDILSFEGKGYYAEQLTGAGTEVTWIKDQGRLLRLFKMFWLLSRMKPQIVLSVHFYLNAYVAIVGRMLSICHMGAIRSNLESEISDAGVLLGRLCVLLPRYLVSNSLIGVTNCRNHGVKKEKVALLDNVVDLEYFRFNPEDRRSSNTILSVGRLGPEKRFHLGMEVLNELWLRGYSQLGLEIAGDGPMLDQLKEKAQQIQMLDGQIKLHGQVSDLRGLYSSARVLLVSSAYEGSPNVVLEAMACGLPVVGFSVDGVRELVQNGRTGLLAPNNDVSKLADCVEVIINHPETAMRLAVEARKHVRNRHSLTSLPDSIAEVFTKALSAHSRSTVCVG